MAHSAAHEAIREVVVNMPAPTVHRLIAEVGEWPLVFRSVIHAERDGAPDRFRCWHVVNGRVRSTTLVRVSDADRSMVEFRHESGSVAEAWSVEPLTAGTCRIRVTEGSPARLAELRAHVDAPERVRFTFFESIRIDIASRAPYDFLVRADRWAQALPHVEFARVEQTDQHDVQVLELGARMPGDHTLTTTSHRLCLPERGLFGKDVVLPALMALHLVTWTFMADGAGLLVTAGHTAELEPANVEAILGVGAGVAEARAHIQDALAAHDRVTLRHVKDLAESARPGRAH
jgi:aromatase